LLDVKAKIIQLNQRNNYSRSSQQFHVPLSPKEIIVSKPY